MERILGPAAKKAIFSHIRSSIYSSYNFLVPSSSNSDDIRLICINKHFYAAASLSNAELISLSEVTSEIKSGMKSAAYAGALPNLLSPKSYEGGQKQSERNDA